MSEQTDAKSNQPDGRDATGVSDHEQHRSGPGEGQDAPFAADAGHAEFAVFDGKGNESVVVVTENEQGKVVESAGESSAEAMKKAGKQEERIAPVFNTPPHDK
jgi:hypothetical protein